ncbi:hypothetical protein E2F43_14185 [Seongchinamella unica]|uniref:Uncharacterized protein n=1 Tax=Seongchinamella unica TaxID=2547392 RepID=A0A4R5LQC9_9GAMM|nr:hypothetical protein [Seongchinamella unica]TDG12721.1 hypothetical protein E2F43_14185 [Seongchinamella unica]
MNKVPAASVAFAFAAMLSYGQAVSAQGGPVKAAPVDFRACSFREGKGMKDLDRISEKFRDYASEHDFNYAAWTLIPQFQSAVPYDIGWLGAWPSNEAFGISMEKWMTTGKELAGEFNEVMDCGSRHELALWVPVTAAESTPEEGVLMISRCALLDGKTNDDAYQAHIAFGNHMRGLGSMASSWLFYPTMGTVSADFDYYHAVAFYRYSDFGAALELYSNGGGYQVAQETLETVSDCTTPILFDALNVRAFDER